MQNKLTLILVLLIGISIQSSCQDLKLIKKVFALGIEQQYYVLKYEKNIKNGPYWMIFKNLEVLQSVARLRTYL